MSQVGKQAALLDAFPVVQNNTDRDTKYPSPDTNFRVHNLTTAYVEQYGGANWNPIFSSEKGGNQFNVKAYGAKCDGTTDDSAAVQAALTAIKNAGGGVLLHPGGTCIAQNLSYTGPGPLTIVGAGSRVSLFKLPAAATHNLLTVTGCSFRYHDIGFDGNQANQSGTGVAMDLVSFDGTSGDHDASHVRFQNIYSVGFHATNINGRFLLHDFTVDTLAPSRGVTYPDIAMGGYIPSGSGLVDIQNGWWNNALPVDKTKAPCGVQLQGTSLTSQIGGVVAHHWFNGFGGSSTLLGCVDLYNWGSHLEVFDIHSTNGCYCAVKVENSTALKVHHIWEDTPGQSYGSASVFFGANTRSETGNFDDIDIHHVWVNGNTGGAAVDCEGVAGSEFKRARISDVTAVGCKDGVIVTYADGPILTRCTADGSTGATGTDGGIVLNNCKNTGIVEHCRMAAGAGYGLNVGTGNGSMDLIVRHNTFDTNTGYHIYGRSAFPTFTAHDNRFIGVPATTMNVTATSGLVYDNIAIGSTNLGLSGITTMLVQRGNQMTTGASRGRATLVAGTVTVNTAEVQANDNIRLTHVVNSGTIGELTANSIVAGTSFAIGSASGTDTGTVFWEIVH